MTRIYVGPTVLYSLGQIGELSLLTHLDGRIVIPEAVQAVHALGGSIASQWSMICTRRT